MSSRLGHRPVTLPHVAASLLAVLSLGVAATPAVAAENCQAPPGTAGIDQYCETIPGPGGDHGTNGAGGGGQDVGGRHNGGVSPGTRHELGQAGRDGAGVLGIAGAGAGGTGSARSGGVGSGEAGGTPGSASERNDGGNRAGGSARQAPRTSTKEPGDNPLAAVQSAAESGATLSPAFVFALLALALAAAAVAWVRYRGRTRHQE